MSRILVEDVDRLAENLVRAARQKMLDRLQCRQGARVQIVDPEIDDVACHHVDRHLFEHLPVSIVTDLACASTAFSVSRECFRQF